MKKNFFIGLMILAPALPAKAEDSCIAKERGWVSSCSSSTFITDGSSASCGEGCTYTYNNGTITITADNEHYDNPQIRAGFLAEHRYMNNTLTDENGNPLTIKKVLIDGAISFGGDAFNCAYSTNCYTVSGKNGTLIINDIDWNAFVGDTLTGNIIWKGLSHGGLNNSVKINGNLIIEDTATVTGSEGSFYLGENGKVFCKTDMDKCKILLAAAGATDELIFVAQAYPKGCDKLALSGDCAKCSKNYTSIGGECLPRRYTPAEVAKVVGESNTILLYYK